MHIDLKWLINFSLMMVFLSCILVLDMVILIIQNDTQSSIRVSASRVRDQLNCLNCKIVLLKTQYFPVMPSLFKQYDKIPLYFLLMVYCIKTGNPHA